MRRLAFLAASFIGVTPLVAQDAGEADRARRELDRLNAQAQAQAAADRARTAREDAQRLAAEADARQQALAAEYARRRSESQAQSQAAQSEADLARRAAEQRLHAAEDAAGRAEAQRDAATAARPPLAQPSTTAPRRRRPADLPAMPRPPSDVADQPVIAMREAVTLCQRDVGDRWRCTGPLRVAYGNIRQSRAAAVDACAAAPIRDLGTVRGLRAFGCGYGLNPRSVAPGNRDVPALFGVDIPDRATFRCPADVEAGCRRR